MEILEDILDRLLSNKGRRLIQWFKHNLLLILTFLGIIIGIILGFALKNVVEESWARFLGFPGAIFLRVLQMMIVPIIISSLISGTATLQTHATGLMAARTLAFFLLSTIICAILGLIMVLLISPGSTELQSLVRGTEVADTKQGGEIELTILDAIMDLIRNVFPENLVFATMKQVHTVYIPDKQLVIGNKTDDGNKTINYYKQELRFREGINALGLITFCMAFGTVLGTLGTSGAVMKRFFRLLDEIVTRLIRIFISFTPIGVASLICERILLTSNLVLLFANLGYFMLTVILCLLIHQIILLPAFYFLVTRKNPFKFAVNCGQAWLTAFALASSSATLPITFRCMEEKNVVNLQVLRFVLPTGATINMNGTVIFMTVAPIFLAQIHGLSITISKYITVLFMAISGSIASAAIPSSALFMMIMLTNTLGLPSNDISILFTIDWLLDRCRTTSNVMSDCYGAALIEHWSKKELMVMERIQGYDDEDDKSDIAEYDNEK